MIVNWVVVGIGPARFAAMKSHLCMWLTFLLLEDGTKIEEPPPDLAQGVRWHWQLTL